MANERTRRIEGIYHQVLEKGTEQERLAYLDSACGDDSELRAAVEGLLKAHDKLQSSLNQFRDMNLQYSRLRDYKLRMKKVQAVRKVSLEAVEQLIADRKREKIKARKKVISQIENFTRKKMRKRFKSTIALLDKGGRA